ncbi:hypothetical protein COW20_14805, partial [bacterium (Candidatus Blackallbacteria) CG13_big_fil_rev_8_21_14_2_50_49_14]
MSEDVRPRKKSLWKILNTPVQDLFKEDGWVDPAAAESAETTESVSQEPQSEAPAARVETAPVLKTEAAPLDLQATELSESQSERPEQAPVPAENLAPEASVTHAAPDALSETSEALAEDLSAPASEPDVSEESEATVVAAEEVSESEPQEGDWLKSFKGMLWLGIGKEKPRVPQQEKQSWLARFRERLSKSRNHLADNLHRLAKGRTKVDEDMLEELEEILLQSDMGIATTDRILDFLRAEAKKRRFLPSEVVPALMKYLEEEMQSEPFRVEEGKLNIVLVVGVNGTGKTTTVGKVAAKLKISGYKVMLAAGDTFRAAAIDQLAVWGNRVGCPVIRHNEGADAAAVVFD